MSNLQTAISIATTAHSKQTRFNGDPYILHPLRIMFKMSTEEEKIVAMLHDVIEDTDVTISDLTLAGFSDKIIEAVFRLTRTKTVDYDTYLITLARNDLARKVKIADLKDNMDITELDTINEKMLKRLAKYHRSYNFLLMFDGE